MCNDPFSVTRSPTIIGGFGKTTFYARKQFYGRRFFVAKQQVLHTATVLPQVKHRTEARKYFSKFFLRLSSHTDLSVIVRAARVNKLVLATRKPSLFSPCGQSSLAETNERRSHCLTATFFQHVRCGFLLVRVCTVELFVYR